MHTDNKTLSAAETDAELKLWQSLPKPPMPKFATREEETAYLLGVIDGRRIEQDWQKLLAEQSK